MGINKMSRGSGKIFFLGGGVRERGKKV